MSFDPIRLMVADDSSAFREGLRALLASVDDVAIIEEAASGDEAVVRAAASQPDVILMDLQMPILNGIHATRRINATSPHIAVLMLTAFEDDESVLAAMQAGARGYLLKGSTRREIVQAVEVVSRGGVLFGPGVAKRILEQLSPVPAPTAVPFAELSDREREILSLMAEGIDNTEIAERLSLSEKTVRNHVHNVYGKLQVTSRAAAVVPGTRRRPGGRAPLAPGPLGPADGHPWTTSRATRPFASGSGTWPAGGASRAWCRCCWWCSRAGASGFWSPRAAPGTEPA